MKSTKVTARLVGGLGNQLFIYSAGKYLAHLTNRQLVLDSRYLDTDRSKHGVSIANFNVEEKFLEKRENHSISRIYIFQRFAKRMNHMVQLINHNTYIAQGLGFEKTLEERNRRTIVGYFQTWRYADYLKSINALSLDLVSPSPKFLELAQLAKEVRPIIIHVRRGDFADSVNWYMGLLSDRYYQSGLRLLASKGITGEIWVFSDDSGAAASTLSFLDGKQVMWVSGRSNQLSPEEELILMSFGGAHIIANSTFSWWGAYLSQSSKSVVAPKEWFQFKEEPLDLIPPNWTRIPSSWAIQ